MKTRVLYFSYLRERVGKSEEEMELPQSVSSVDDFLDWLAGLGEEYEAMMEFRDVLRVAVNKRQVSGRTASVAGAKEIALYPPMTGG